MRTLFIKEISSFFSSLTGYIVVILFTLATGLFMWVVPGELNIAEAGYANLDTLFILAPWVFLFLVPSITMRMFSEEFKTGTMELLVTRPLSTLQIVGAKYFAAVLLVILSLLPSLISFISVWILGNPPGNIDTGGFLGSLIGLFLLAAIYAAVGIFCSSLTDNQIIGFLLAVAFSFFLYIGFESISSLAVFRNKEELILLLGINEHYKSMSRGVMDSRDVVYFIGVIALFISSTQFILERRKR